MPSKVLLRFFMDVNFGDDAMIELLLSSYPDIIFYFSPRKPAYLALTQKYANLRLLAGGYTKNIILNSKRFDAYLFVGGSVFNYNTILGLMYQIKEILFCLCLRLKDVRCFVVGSNLSPMPRGILYPAARVLLKTRIMLLNFISARDNYTKKSIEAIAANKVQLAPDIVFGTKRRQINENSKMAGILGISAFAPRINAQRDERFYQAIAKLIDEYLKTGDNRRVKLFLFSTGDSGDLEAAERIVRLTGKSGECDIVKFEGDIDWFTDQITECSRFLPVRFHSIILCLIYSIPFVPIIYANKSANLLQDISYNGPSYNISGFSSADTGILIEQISNADEIAMFSEEQFEDLTRQSKRHFQVLNDL